MAAFLSFSLSLSRSRICIFLWQFGLEAKQRGNESPRLRAVEYNTYDRNPYVSAAAKRRANGKCQLCGKSAPFLDPHGQPYLETHHIIWLSRGGPDTLDNTVALCRNRSNVSNSSACNSCTRKRAASASPVTLSGKTQTRLRRPSLPSC